MSLRFGIPSLDELIEVPQQGVQADEPTTCSSFALLGPDGTGKSVLALHLASRYHFDCMTGGATDRPVVVYVSSDLKWEAANMVWEKFRLDEPGLRQIPFERTAEMVDRHARAMALAKELQRQAGEKQLNLKQITKLRLRKLIPVIEATPPNDTEDSDDILQFLDTDRFPVEIGFLDLAGYSAGDDWSFLNTLLGKLSQRACPVDTNGKKFPHLVIVDSVAGFETFVGRLDAFGLEQSRRTRIAQCIRHAGANCHLGFVVEESREAEHQPEEFVTDVVVRLRRKSCGASMIRTIEVEKARARSMALGEHPFEILSDQGTSTGVWENVDHPRSKNNYVHVHHSLSHRNQLVSSDRGGDRPEVRARAAEFGIPYLDSLLPFRLPNEQAPHPGLESGSVSALIGDFGTGKTALAERFLAEGLKPLAELWRSLRIVLGGGDVDKRKAVERIGEALAAPILGPADSKELLTGPPSTKKLPLPPPPPKDCRNAERVTRYWLRCLRYSARRSNSAAQKMGIDTGKLMPVLDAMWPKAEENNGPIFRLRRLLDRARNNPLMQVALGGETKDHTKHTLDLKQFSSWLFDLPQFQFPVVLLTTSDVSPSRLARSFVTMLLPELSPANTHLSPDDENEVVRLVEQQIVLRRFDIAATPAASLFHIIQQNVIYASLQAHQFWFPASRRQRCQRADRIRLVIDEVNALAAMCPEVTTDTTFLPSLKFFLEREGITTLVVYGEAVRPDLKVEESLASKLQTLFHRTIMLWPVPFEGEKRVAVTVIPNRERRKSGLVRELVVERRDSMRSETAGGQIVELPSVTPRFELYSGVEEGHPKPVPLAILLYAETEAFNNYIESEDWLFRELFVGTAQNQGRVLVPIGDQQVNALRENAMLPLDKKNDHTLVFQVDAHWVLSEGDANSLIDLREHLFEKFQPGIRRYQDPFGVFSGEPIHQKKISGGKSGSRVAFFANSGYQTRLLGFPHETQRQLVANRAPYMWDFGFMLLRHSAWTAASEQKFAFAMSSSGKKIERSIGEVLGGIEEQIPICWREFLGACQAVARHTEVESGINAQSFDFAGPSPETLNCLVLEMWMSEIQKELEAHPQWGRGTEEEEALAFLSVDKWDPGESTKSLNLSKLLRPQGQHQRISIAFDKLRKETEAKRKGSRQAGPTDAYYRHLSVASFAMYKVWLLLLEAIDFESLFDDQETFHLRPAKTASISAVASRHWYKTACAYSRALRSTVGADSLPLAVRIPGVFSTRGDWFLAAPTSSRSELLARHAIDLLCSRRANIIRMQLGLGLPTRDIVDSDSCGNMRTALISRSGASSHKIGGEEAKHSALLEMRYEELCRLTPAGQDDKLKWLWRSSIKDYDRLSRPLQKWIARMFRWTIQFRRNFRGKTWEGGFHGYDALTQKLPWPIMEYPSFMQFGELLDLLVSELKAAERALESK